MPRPSFWDPNEVLGQPRGRRSDGDDEHGYTPSGPYGMNRGHDYPRAVINPWGPRSVSPQSNRRDRDDAASQARPEVRFTLPRSQLASSAVEPLEDILAPAAEPEEVPPSNPTPSNQLTKLRQRLESLKAKLQESVEVGNYSRASDLQYYAIPEIEQEILEQETLEQKTLESKKGKAPKPASAKKAGRKSYQAEIETESEQSDDE